MTALTKDRNTYHRVGDFRSGPMKADETTFAGGILLRLSDGYLAKGQVIAGAVGVGIAERAVLTAGDTDGAVSVEFRPGSHLMQNSAGGDAVTLANIGAVCYAVDDQTVALTDASGTRSVAGFVEDIEGSRVWVRFDETLARIV